MPPIRPVFACLLPLPLVLLANTAQAQPTRNVWDDFPPLPGTPGAQTPVEPPATSPPAAPEPPSPPFGAKGQWVLDGGTTIGISSTSYDASAASRLSGVFSPNINYFFLKNVSIGLDVDVSYSDNVGYGADSSVVETKTTSVAGGPRFGLNLPFSRGVSWWLTGTLGIESIHTAQSLVSGSSISTASSAGATVTSQDGPYVSLSLPLLLHPAPHFFLGAGPNLFHEFGALQGGPNVGDQRTSIGGGFVVGGYWGGAPDASTAPAPDAATSTPRARRFGEQGEVVLTNELVASVASTAYAGTTSSALGGSLAVGADFFFVDHVSMGLALNGSGNNSTGLDSNGNAVTNTDTSYGVSFRFGVEIPLASAVSLYPRASLGLELGNQDERSTAGEDAYSFAEVWVSGYVPLIVRVAPHFFAGFGPSVSRDLSNTATFPQGQQESNPATTYGAGFIVGGWL